MVFYVHAIDRPGVIDRLIELGEEHWSYMDRFDSRLILRGPTLSDDGEDHTGSVHVVDLADRAAAERFATEEPYWSAGLYGDLTVAPAEVLLRREPDASAPHTLVTTRWPARPRHAGQWFPGAEPDGRLGFVAVLVDDEQDGTTGLVAAVRALPDEARNLIRPLADLLSGGPTPLTAQRWQRGGRH
ncbi:MULTISPECIES: YciI family protein [unclassified Streptomyces]|uniref:YciI family protein n=1 Tax=unclassified Streptomyces TaxID=2593676 RepID=UPI0016615CCD|nr:MULTISPECIES: YciI family protein [unclassified Streptomyces]MBD0711154.1 hypothetical protein [Streptomyces sp. CBMA291]MBD0714185.1 hypothetical protein [Streptomyces sp. CBMA370]